MAETSTLLACTKCLTKYPSLEFSSHSTQICNKCRKISVYKCVYCRLDFKQESKPTRVITVCEKCEKNVKLYGKPKTCLYCNISAAFIGNKCQRCTHLEHKYGVPITCEQCKQKCAFNGKEDKKKGDGKALCWLCTLSYKRALARAKLKSDQKTHIRVHVHRKNQRPDVTQIHNKSHREHKDRNNSSHKNNLPIEKIDDQSNVISMLREKSGALERQLAIKDAKLMEKDREITRLQADHFTKEQEMMNANTTRKHTYDKEVENLHTAVKTLQREVARLKKLKTINGATTNSPININ